MERGWWYWDLLVIVSIVSSVEFVTENGTYGTYEMYIKHAGVRPTSNHRLVLLLAVDLTDQ